MPGLSGIELIAKLDFIYKSTQKELNQLVQARIGTDSGVEGNKFYQLYKPFTIILANEFKSDIYQDCMTYGVNDFVVKPLMP